MYRKGAAEAAPFVFEPFFEVLWSGWSVGTVMVVWILTFYPPSSSEAVLCLPPPHLVWLSLSCPFQVLMWHVCNPIWAAIWAVMGPIPCCALQHRWSA